MHPRKQKRHGPKQAAHSSQHTPSSKLHMSFTRPATHAAPNGRGWYEADPQLLKLTIDKYFREASHLYDSQTWERSRMTALIAPHAGMSYSGRTASEAFATLREYLYADRSQGNKVERVFILGPSHTKGFSGCEISVAKVYETPFGPLNVDTTVVDDLLTAFRNAGVPVNKASRRTDEAEHSIEMETPYLSYILHHPPTTAPPSTEPVVKRISIVPIIVGWTNREDEKSISDVLKPYMDDSRNFFIFSSDFCHWGERFSYTYHYKPSQYPDIGDSIIAMDHAGMKLLEMRDLEGWYNYLKTTENTICGRVPISIGMHRWANNANKVQIKFVHYSQSNKCRDTDDSSVSYASAVIIE